MDIELLLIEASIRTWVTQTLREFLIKGFVLDDERLKEMGGGNYFDELLGQIRNIRASEKVFWRKVLDIYFRQNIDYSPQSELAKEFFAAVQNNKDTLGSAWAHSGGNCYARSDATKPYMGLNFMERR